MLRWYLSRTLHHVKMRPSQAGVLSMRDCSPSEFDELLRDKQVEMSEGMDECARVKERLFAVVYQSA